MKNKVLIKLFGYPVLLIIGSPLTMLLFNSWLAASFAESTLVGTEDFFRTLVLWVGTSAFAFGWGWLSLRCYRHCQWETGNSNCCHECGGIVITKTKKNESYLHCLICESDRNIYY